MLAQNFKTAADLGISELRHGGLIKTLGVLERGEVRHVPVPYSRFVYKPQNWDALFNMSNLWTDATCGTAACIAGTSDLIFGTDFVSAGCVNWPEDSRLDDLFCPNGIDEEIWGDITTAQAATALRSYLTTGDANWAEAIAAQS